MKHFSMSSEGLCIPAYLCCHLGDLALEVLLFCAVTFLKTGRQNLWAQVIVAGLVQGCLLRIKPALLSVQPGRG